MRVYFHLYALGLGKGYLAVYYRVRHRVTRFYCQINRIQIGIQHIQIITLSITASDSITDHCFVSQFIKSNFCFPCERREKRVIQIRNKYTNNSCPITKKVSCQFIWCISQFFDCLFNLFTCISRYISTVIDNSRHSTDTYSGSLCHIFHTCHSLLNLSYCYY